MKHASLPQLCLAAAGLALSPCAFATWSIDYTDATKVTITDGNWKFAVSKKGDYGSYSGAIATDRGFKITEAIDIPTNAAVATIDFSTFREDTRAAQEAIGVSEPYGVVASTLASSALSSAAVVTFNAPDLVWLGSTFCNHLTIKRISVSSNFCDKTDAMLSVEKGTPALKTFTPTVLPNWQTIPKKAFYQQKNLEGDFVFANATQAGGDGPFWGAASITSLTFPSLVDKVGNLPFYGMSSLTNFYAPKCTYIGSSVSFRDCVKLGDVTLSSALSALGGNSFYGCTSLTNLYPKTFTNVTTVAGGAFINCSKLRGTLSFPAATSVGGAFSGAAVEEVCMPLAKITGDNNNCPFNGCPNLKKVTALGSADELPKNMFNLSTTGCVVHFLGDDVPTTKNGSCQIHGADTSPLVFCLHTKAAQEGWVAQWATRTADQLTDADKAMSTYPGPKATLAYCQPAYNVKFWLTRYFVTTNVTIQCPANVQVARVEQDGLALDKGADGTYEADLAAKMVIAYAATGNNLFSDGSAQYVVSNVAVGATIPASVCDRAVLPAVASVGGTKYLSLQAAFDVGGEATLLTNVDLSASVSLAADKTLSLDLGGYTLTAVGITAFVNAGALDLGNGTVSAGTLVDNTGVFQVRTGTYSEDVTDWCASGFHVVAQPTTPPTWKVVENVTRNLSLAISSLAANHITNVTLECAGAFTCTTNAGVIVWSLPEAMPYTLTYEGEFRWRFDGSTAVTVVNATGIFADTTVSPSEVPVPTKVYLWVWDSVAKTLSDGNWTFNEVTKTTEYGATGLKIASAAFSQTDVAVSNVDFTTCAETTGWPLIIVTGSLKTLPVRKFTAPDAVSLAQSFAGNAYVEEVVVSPDIQNLGYVGGGCFNGCSNLRKVTPTKMPKLAFAKCLFNNCKKLEGDFEFDAWTVVTHENPFTYCEKITSLKFPNLTACNKSTEFGYMYSLTNFYAPKLTYLYNSTLTQCTNLRSVVISDAVYNIGYGVFNNCKNIESFHPTVFTNLSSIGATAFSKAKEPISGDLVLPKATFIGESAFSSCLLLKSVTAPELATVERSVCENCSRLASFVAPNAGFGNNAKWAFSCCTNLTEVVIKGGSDIGEQHTFDKINPHATIYWLGTNVPTRIGLWGITGPNSERINICIKDATTRQGWIDAFATRVRADFTAADFANATYPGACAQAVAAPAKSGTSNYFWISRPPLPLSVFIR